MGKSRLAEALRERLGDEPHAHCLYQCSPYHVGSALHPIVEQLEQVAGFRRADGREERLDKLERMLARKGEDLPAAAPLFAALLSLPTGERYRYLDLTPQRWKERTLEVLLARLEGLAAQGPALLVFEDLHWIDPTSLELLGLLVERTANLPLLALLTARPEFVPPSSWTSRRHVTLLSLDHLDRRQAAVLADCVSGNPLPSEMVEQIVARADGVPLFIEELTRMVLEAGLAGDAGGRHVLGGSLPPFAIPATLHDSLMARLDRLAWAKEVAQVAACIGRDFSHEMLATVSAIDAEPLAAALDQLAGCDLIVRRGTPPDVTYAFRHALIQEAAYGSMLKSDRQALHAHIARAVEEHYAHFADARPEWLAHHCTEAGLVGPATDYWLKAALRAKDAYANREAAAHLRKCLEVIEGAPAGAGEEGTELDRRKLQALALLGDLASLTGDLEEANRCYARALQLPGDASARLWVENKRHRPRSLVRNGGRIAFYEHGTGGRTLVFVAPLAYGLSAFQPLVERLCQEFHVVTIDTRGTGASDPLTRPYGLHEHVMDLHAVITSLGGGPVRRCRDLARRQCDLAAGARLAAAVRAAGHHRLFAGCRGSATVLHRGVSLSVPGNWRATSTGSPALTPNSCSPSPRPGNCWSCSSRTA